jgi:hypothetical protein
MIVICPRVYRPTCNYLSSHTAYEVVEVVCEINKVYIIIDDNEDETFIRADGTPCPHTGSVWEVRV